MTAACVAFVFFWARNCKLKQRIVLQSETQSSAPHIFGVKSETSGSGSNMSASTVSTAESMIICSAVSRAGSTRRAQYSLEIT